MKKQNQKTKKTETAIAADVIARQIVEGTKPAPSVRALMFRISAITRQAARSVAAGHDRANVCAAAVRAIEETAALYWKHHAAQEVRP